jgi:hypothetical protein
MEATRAARDHGADGHGLAARFNIGSDGRLAFDPSAAWATAWWR